MRNYEIMFIVRPTLGEDEIKKVAASFQKTLETNGAKVTGVDAWGQRTLAYEIKAGRNTYKSGYYFVVTIEANDDASRYFDKGNLIGIEGRIQTGSYDDKDGNKRYTVDVALDNFEFVESKAARDASANSSSSYDAMPTPYDYQEPNNSMNTVNVENDPFAEFGDSVSIDDNFLE